MSKATKMDEVEVESKPGTYPNLDDIIVEGGAWAAACLHTHTALTGGQDDGPTLLLPCIVCNKTFKPEVLQRHSKVCEKNTHKKRKTFDSFKQRVQGTDLAEFLPFSTLQKRASFNEKPPSPKKVSSHWKENHEAFVSAIRAARGEEPDATGGSGDSRSLLRPPDHEQCPYCERHFGKKAFDRHQEWCREHHSRHPPVTASSQAKERLEARIKYRAPPMKSKRAITREKYSPLVQRKVRQASPSSNSNFSSNSTTGSATSSAGSSRHTFQTQLEQTNRLSRSGNSLSGRSLPTEPSSGLGFSRGMAGRTSLRASQRAMQRPSSPNKRPSGSKSAASPTRRHSHEGPPPRIYEKDDLMVTSMGTKKAHTKNQTTKHLDTKVNDYQKTKGQKKPSQNGAENVRALQIEVKTKEVKESSPNGKSSKNDQLWRHDNQAKRTTPHSFPFKPHSPVLPTTIMQRSLLVEKEAHRNRRLHSVTNSIDVNSYVTEMIVTQIGPRNVQHGDTMTQKSSVSNACPEALDLRKKGTINAGPRDINCAMKLCEGPSIDNGSDENFGFSYSSETLTSSSGSADSNRTYITQSSLCCKADYEQNVHCGELDRTLSEDSHLKTSGSRGENLQIKSNNFTKVSGTLLPNLISEEDKTHYGKIAKRVTSKEFLPASSDVSDRERFIPRKRVKIHHFCKNSEKEESSFKPCPSFLQKIDQAQNPQFFNRKCKSFCNQNVCSAENSPLFKREETSPPFFIRDNVIPFQSVRYTWFDIARNGSQKSSFVKFRTHSNCRQPQKLHPSESYPIIKDKYENDMQRKRLLKTDKMQLPKLLLSKSQNFNEEKSGFSCNGPIFPVPETYRISPSVMHRNISNVRLAPVPFKLSGNRQEESYDPYASAERQMMELLRSDSACNISKKPASSSPAPSISPMPSPTLSPKPSPLETSPTSAFTRYAKESESLLQVGNETENVEKAKSSDDCGIDINASLMNSPQSNSNVEQIEMSPSQQYSPPKVAASTAPTPTKPQPPPRSNKRLASLPKTREEPVVSAESSAPHLQSNSLDAVLKDLDSSFNSDLDNRPKTYDLDSHFKSGAQSRENRGWCNISDSSSLMSFALPTILDSADGGKIEILNLDNRTDSNGRRETRESREIREITEHDSDISDIDNLLEEVVRMQRSVSMLSEMDPATVKGTSVPANQSSARSRRNRAGKMLIEDFLFPAEQLQRENNNVRSSVETSDRSNSVFGSTKSRKSSAKSRRLIEDMLFPPGTDLNANSDHNEDGDVVVSANALTVSCSSPNGFSSKLDSFVTHCSTSPVALTSKFTHSGGGDDGLPRPKPVSLSAHSSARNGCKEGYDPSVPSSPMQPPSNQCRQSTSSRLSADSAYSSLNRRSPVPQVRRQFSAGVQDGLRHGAESPQSILSQSLTQSLVLSSSGSESSLPPLSSSQPLKRSSRSKHDCDTPSSDIVSATTPLLPKLSKFCHHCGTKFLITVAKFCHECGAARLEIC